MVVVSNSFTLMALARIGQFSLLKSIFGLVYIPDAVYDEVVKNGEELPGAKEVKGSDWIKVHSVENNELLSSMRSFLDPGESEAIALALEINADWLIIDEQLARDYSQDSLKLKVIGTLGILLMAKGKGLITDISSQLGKLTTSGFRISRRVYREILRSAGEFKGFIATQEADDKSELLEILSLNPQSFTIHEDIENIEFIRGIPSTEKLKEQGRNFSENIEIKWQKLHDKYHIVALSEDKSYLTNFNVSKKAFDLECVSYILWGRYKPDINHDKNIFIEVSIPGYLKYPISASKENERLCIRAYNYVEDGVVQFTRYLSVVANIEK